MRAFITGATGQVGQALVRRCLERFERVHVVTRGEAPVLAAQPRISVFRGEIDDAAAVAAAVTGCDVVFHAAARVHARGVGPVDPEAWRVNRDGTAELLRQAGRAGVSRFVYFSTISVYGPTPPDQVFDETSPARGTGAYAESKQAAERLVLDAADGPMSTVVLRLASVFGPGVKGNYRRLVDSLASGYYVPIGDGKNRRTLVHEEDVAEAAILAAEHPAATGIYNVTGAGISTVNEIVEAICDALGRRPPRIRVPLLPVTAAAAAADLAMRVAGKRPFARDTVAKLTEDVAVSGERLQRELGYRPRIDLRRGWETVIARQRLR